MCIRGWFGGSSELLLLVCEEANSPAAHNDSAEWLHDYTSFTEVFVFFPLFCIFVSICFFGH